MTSPVREHSTVAGPAPARLHVVDDRVGLSAALRAYREQRTLSFRQAGALVGGSHWVWANWEDGARPSPVYLRRLAALFGLPVEELRALVGPDRVRRPASVGDATSHPIARARVDREMSAADLARRLHVSASLVSRWESGERVPCRHYWAPIAAELRLDVCVLERLYAEAPAASDSAIVTGLRDTRVRRGVTQLQLAHQVGVDVTSIQRWEQAGRAPSRRAREVATALGVDLTALARPALVRRQPRTAVTALRRLRRSRNLSTRLVAARAGVSPAALLSWERGCSVPSWGQARSLARALAVPVADVFAALRMPSPRHLDPSTWTAEDLPDILCELRRWQGWTQQRLADLLDVGAATVRSWERGRQRPRRRALEGLDALLGVTPRLADVVYPRARR